MKIVLAYLTVVFGIAFHPSASAQITFGGCADIRGIPVDSKSDSFINDVAIASLTPNGVPIIRYNPTVLSSLSPQTRLFFYAHECGHHALGHNFGTVHPLRMEQDADCFAITTLVSKNMINNDDLTAIQIDIANRGKGDWTHLPGPQRAINLRGCFNSTSGIGSNVEKSSPANPANPPSTPYGYKQPDWVIDEPTTKEKNRSVNPAQPSRFGRYLQITQDEIPRLFDINLKSRKFEEKGVCVGRFEFARSNYVSDVADLDFKENVKFKLGYPDRSELWVDIWEFINKDPSPRSTLLSLKSDGTVERLGSFRMVSYVKQENADRAVKVMNELVKICNGPAM